jgi:DNA-binding beta-propeller fold protein YncE
MTLRVRIPAAASLAASLLWTGAVRAQEPRGGSRGYEVWIVDQSDTKGQNHGGTLYVFSASDLKPGALSSSKPGTVVDIAGETAALCREKTGANPVRPHMVLFNREQTHALMAFVASGHVVVFDAASRKPLECLRATEAPTGRQAHAAFPSPDGSYVLIANQNGKRLERIESNFARNTFTHNAAATLDLATCKTPGGAPCQAPDVRPDNAPICPVISDDGRLAFVTLRGGGMFVVDPKATPMRIVAEYDVATVKGNGCGGAQVAGQMYVNSGGRPGPIEHLHVYGFDVYKFSLDAFRGSTAAAPNTPAPKVVFKADGPHDSHGMVVTGNGRYLWVMDRHADVVEILETAADSRVRTLSLNGSLTGNAAPDLTDVDPSGNLVFTAFRGPTPLSGDPHNAKGDTPGLAVLEVLEGGRNGRLLGLVRLSNVGSDGVERADPHALRVRRVK